MFMRRDREEEYEYERRDYGSIVRKIIMIVCVCVFAFSSFKVASILMEYKKANEVYAGTADKFTEIFEDHVLPTVDFEGLKAINEDVIAWIFQENTPINYPVLKCKNNNEYLRHTMERKYLTAGSIYIDFRCDPDFKNPQTMIYGHRMKNHSMFGSLGKYSDKAYLDENKYIYLLLPDGTYEKYEVFSYFVVNIEDVVYTLPTSSMELYEKTLESINRQNIYKDLYQATKDDKIISLSTCTGYFLSTASETERVFVSARLVEKKEINYQ